MHEVICSKIAYVKARKKGAVKELLLLKNKQRHHNVNDAFDKQ